MTWWRRALAICRDRRMVAIWCMGFSSGLPFPLVYATLSFWLSQAGVSRAAVSAFVLAGFSYNYKFLWSPVIDQLPIPLLTRRMGRRRSWAIALQLPLAAAIFGLGRTDPAIDLWPVALLTIIVAFLSASQDIVIDAYRIELLSPEEQGIGAAATQWGWRVGALASSTGALDIVQVSASWATAYAVMAALMSVGILAVLLTREPAVAGAAIPRERQATRRKRVAAWLRVAVAEPFKDFMRRRGWVTILILIVLYKLGEALAGTMSNPLYRELGFSPAEVGNIGKMVGFVATLLGVAGGGLLVVRLGLFRALLVAGVLQMLSTLLYIALLVAGHDDVVLGFSIFGENFTGGMASAAFVAYLSRLCSPGFTATQYALYSSLAAVPARFLSAPSGWLVNRIDWIPFFAFATLACVPSLLLLWWMGRRGDIDASPARAIAE
jgi:PAT family beta-lactamase induction signal transducer AmpG